MANVSLDELLREIADSQAPHLTEEIPLFSEGSDAPLTEQELREWYAWIASPSFRHALDTILVIARSRAVEAAHDSIRVAANARDASRTADLLDRRDATWAEVDKLLFAYRLLLAMRNDKLEPRKLHRPL